MLKSIDSSTVEGGATNGVDGSLLASFLGTLQRLGEVPKACSKGIETVSCGEIQCEEPPPLHDALDLRAAFDDDAVIRPAADLLIESRRSGQIHQNDANKFSQSPGPSVVPSGNGIVSGNALAVVSMQAPSHQAVAKPDPLLADTLEGCMINGVSRSPAKEPTTSSATPVAMTYWPPVADSDEDYVYDGELINGKPHGQGRMTYSSGEVYEGQFEDGLPSGGGTFLRQIDGGLSAQYTGEWSRGLKHGFGIETWPDGMRYEGEFRDGDSAGSGKMIFQSGMVRRVVDGLVAQ